MDLLLDYMGEVNGPVDDAHEARLAALGVASRRLAFASLLQDLRKCPYTRAERAQLAADLAQGASNHANHYDIALCTHDPFPSEGVIRLVSRNYGYQFVLIKIEAGPGLLRRSRSQVRIYRAILDQDGYVCVHVTMHLKAALKAIDQAYAVAAALHLP